VSSLTQGSWKLVVDALDAHGGDRCPRHRGHQQTRRSALPSVRPKPALAGDLNFAYPQFAEGFPPGHSIVRAIRRTSAGAIALFAISYKLLFELFGCIVGNANC